MLPPCCFPATEKTPPRVDDLSDLVLFGDLLVLCGQARTSDCGKFAQYEFDRMVPRRRFEYDVVRNKFVRRALFDPLSYGVMEPDAGRLPLSSFFFLSRIVFCFAAFFRIRNARRPVSRSMPYRKLVHVILVACQSVPGRGAGCVPENRPPPWQPGNNFCC